MPFLAYNIIMSVKSLSSKSLSSQENQRAVLWRKRPLAIVAVVTAVTAMIAVATVAVGVFWLIHHNPSPLTRSWHVSSRVVTVPAENPPQVSGKVILPDNAQVRAALTADASSTVEIEGRACGLILEGSGFVVAPGYVVTSANVIAGETHTYVLENGQQYLATPVLYDPKLDISLLRAPTFSRPPLKLDPHLVPDGTASIVMGYPEDGPFTYGTAGVMALYDARGLDIYGNTYVTRQIYGLKAIVRPGNSGGPLAEPNGMVIGVVFVRSTTNSQVGYAIASPAVLSTISPALHDTSRVSTMGCTNA